MDCFEVNAVNYGAPQLRERVIFFGNRYNERVTFPDPVTDITSLASSHGAHFATQSGDWRIPEKSS